MSLVRKIGSGLVWLWVVVFGLCKRLIFRPKKTQLLSAQVENVGTSPATGQEMEWEESWNTMESFSVKVEPSDPNLFQDMEPVLTKTKKVYVGGGKSEKTTPAMPEKQRFAVESSFSALSTGGELGEWKEDEGGGGGGGGWESEMGQEEGMLVMASREAVAKQKREEREKRRKLQEALRFNQRRQLQQQSLLGIRVTES